MELTGRELYIYTLLVGLAFGVLVGLVPLVIGFIKHRRKHAFLGFILTIVGSGIAGLLLAIPVAAIFTWLIYRGSGDTPVSGETNDPPSS